MLKILLSYDDKSGTFNLPHHPLEVGNFLLHVGSSAAYADLRLYADDAPEQVQARLIAETAADRYLQSIISPDARLSAVNTVCEQFTVFPPTGRQGWQTTLRSPTKGLCWTPSKP